MAVDPKQPLSNPQRQVPEGSEALIPEGYKALSGDTLPPSQPTQLAQIDWSEINWPSLQQIRDTAGEVAQEGLKILSDPFAAAAAAASIPSFWADDTPAAAGGDVQSLSGANANIEDLARFMAFAYAEQDASQSAINIAQEQAAHILLSGQRFNSTSDYSNAHKDATQRASALMSQMQQAGADNADFMQAAKSAAESAGIAFDETLQKALEKEAERRDLMAATTGQSQSEQPGSTPGTPRPAKTVGRIDEALDKVNPSVHRLFKEAAAAGEIAQYDPKQADLAAIHFKAEMIMFRDRWLVHLKEGRDPSYISTDIVYGGRGAIEGVYQTAAKSLEAGYNEYQAQRADNDPDLSWGQWATQELASDSSEAFKALVNEIGEEGARQFRDQMNNITEAQNNRMLTNIMEGMTGGNRYYQLAASSAILPRELQEEFKAAVGEETYNQLLDRNGHIKMTDMIDQQTPDTKRMAAAMTLAEYKGTPHYQKQAPVSLQAAKEGYAPAALLFSDGFPISDEVANRWQERGSLVPSYNIEETRYPSQNVTDEIQLSALPTPAAARARS